MRRTSSDPTLESEARERLNRIAELFLRAEESIALVARATPRNAWSELRRLAGMAQGNRAWRAAFEYAPAPEFSSLRRELGRSVEAALSFGELGALHAERARELELEARMAENIGTRKFARLAARRFPEPPAEFAETVAAFVREALAADSPSPARAPSLHTSDDAEDPASLVFQLRRRALELGLALRVELRGTQLAVAATGDGVVAIRPGVLLSPEAGVRIALHELLGHALPRSRALHASLVLFRAGTARSNDHEEGRALVVEERAGLLEDQRRRQLALRHLACVSVRGGADYTETVRQLLAQGARQEQALEIAARAQRGGGLAREIVYIPAYCAVRASFTRRPALERWFEGGRVSLEAARLLDALAAPVATPSQPSSSITTGA